MTPLPTFITTLPGVFLLIREEGATDVEPTVMQDLIETFNSGIIGGQLFVEELGKQWFLRLA